MNPLATELDRDIQAHGFYRAAYPTRMIATQYFLKSLLRLAAARGFWVVIEERDAHVYATVRDVLGVRARVADTLAKVVEN